MGDRNTQVGWSDDQWNRIRQAVSEEAHKARVAASFLPPYGPLPPSTQVVPSERIDHTTGRVDDASTAQVLEIFTEVSLSQQQVNEEELSSALLAFRRASNIVARGEDWIIFNGQHRYRLVNGKPEPAIPAIAGVAANAAANPPIDFVPPVVVDPALKKIPALLRLKGGEQHDAHASESIQQFVGSILGSLDADGLAALPPELIALLPRAKAETTAALALLPAHKKARTDSFSARYQVQFLEARLRVTNPGGLGLVDGTTTNQTVRHEDAHRVTDIIEAITKLEVQGHLAPFVCVLGNEAFRDTHAPIGDTGVLLSDRIEPILGSQFLRSSAIEDRQGVVLSLAGEPIDLAIAVDVSPQFLQVTSEGRYLFRVYERFALRVKEPEAIVRLDFE